VGDIGKRLAATGIPVHHFGMYKVNFDPEWHGRFHYWAARSGGQWCDPIPELDTPPAGSSVTN
jgi:hypothetical protein